MRKLRAILMALSICAALFGCAEKGPWQSLSYHVTSSVMTEGCHFQLTRDGDGLVLTGYCYDGSTEHRAEDPIPVSRETADAIAAMSLERAATAKPTSSKLTDGKQVAVTLEYANGNQRKLSLSPEQRTQLWELLQKELCGSTPDVK